MDRTALGAVSKEGGGRDLPGPDSLASLAYLKLSTRGRVTGLPHIVQLRYVVIDGSFYVISGQARGDWLLNLLNGGGGVVRVADLLYDVSAGLLGTEGAEQVRSEFQLKYGRALFERWYGRSRAVIRLAPSGRVARRGAVAGESGVRSSFGEWKRSGAGYYDAVAAAFDSAAEEYDFTISRNHINTWIRRRSIEILLRLARPDDYLLEIGSGTGAEAIEVARHVRGIFALDVSQAMVDLLAAKVRARRLEGRVFPARLAASELPRVRDLLAGRRVRMAYSFNGALNCEPKIGDFVEELAGLLQPGGIFVCSVRNTLCLTEAVSHAVALQFGKMAPRKHQPVMVSVGGHDVPSIYYPPRGFARVFERRFKVEEMVALPGLLPPAYLNEYYLRLRRLTDAIERLDRLLSGHVPLKWYGDQTLFVFRKST